MNIKVVTTITAAAKTYDLVTLDAIKDELDIRDNSKNATLQRYLTGASVMVSQYCNRVFPAETITESFWAQRDLWPWIIPGGIQNLQLSRWPIQSVTSVTENAIVLVQDIDFKIDATNGQLIRLDTSGYPKLWPVYPIVVVYIGGFTTIPVDVQDAVVRMVTRRLIAKGRDPNLKQQNVIGVLEQQWWVATGAESGNMSPDITDVLDNYRVAVLAA